MGIISQKWTAPVYDEPQFLASLSLIQLLGAIKGVTIRPHSQKTLEVWSQLPKSMRTQISAGIFIYEKILKSSPKAELQSDTVSLEEEKDYLDMALDALGLSFADDFFSSVKEGDIIEIYNAQGIQVYRNFAFFSKCSYSLLDLLTYEWPTLYERAQPMTDAIMTRVAEVIRSGQKTEPFNIPDHTVREKHLNACKIFTMTLGFISPLKDSLTGNNAGEIHTLRAEIVAEGPTANKISYLRH